MTALSALFTLASGGSDVAANLAQPDTPNPLRALGQSPAGVEEAVAWFNTNVESGTQSFLFLIGGPGGGKSHTTAQIVRRFKEFDPKTSKLAHRKHRYAAESSQLKITVINDATIRGREHSSFPLVRDIAAALGNGDSLICCINRGVLLEEILCEEPEYKDIVDLLKGLKESDNQADTLLKAGQYENGKTKIPTLSVAFDVCSLLERTPKTSISLSEDSTPIITAETYRIAEYGNRLSKPEDYETIASDLISKVCKRISDEYDSNSGLMDPVTANLQTLATPLIVKQICTIMRNSEIIANRRLSYRELWGATTLLVVGEAPAMITPEKLVDYIASLQPQGVDAIVDLKMAAKLSDLRLSQAMFGVKFGNPPKAHVAGDSLDLRQSLALVDPFRDAQPGTLLQNIPVNGWATPLHDAFTGAFAAMSPLGALLNNPQLVNLKSVVTDFDRKLDDLFVKAMQSELMKTPARADLIAWYSGYLTRLFAISAGISGFASTFIEWTKLWNLAPLIPNKLKDQIVTLLKPSRVPGANKSSLIPLFDSRTLPIQGELTNPKLSLQVNDLEIKAIGSGNSLFLLLTESDKQSARILLDFPLFREVTACASGHTGVTEQTSISAPRLERIRSSNLVPATQTKIGKYVIATTNGEAEFLVRGGNG